MSVKIKQLSHDKTLLNSRLEFEIEGKTIDHVVVNTLRRIIMSRIPSFMFGDFEIVKNTSVFNNNQLKLHIENIPLIGIKDIPMKYKKKKEEDEEEVDEDLEELIGNDEAELETETEPVSVSSLESLTMYVDYHNKTQKIVSVTTDDVKFYYQGKEIKSPYPNPMVIVKLQPNQEIKLTAKSVLGEEAEDAKFSHVSICAFNIINDNKYKFFIQSVGQLDEKEIIKRACYQINRKLKKLKSVFPSTMLMDGDIKIPNNKHTIGNLMSHGLSLLPEVKYATYYQKHSLDNEIFIKFGLDKERDVKELFGKVCDYYRDIFSKIEKEF